MLSRSLTFFMLWALLICRSASAQTFGDFTQQVPKVSAILSELLKDTYSCSAVGVFRSLEAPQTAETVRARSYDVLFRVTMDQGLMRFDLKLSDIGKELLPEEFAKTFKDIGWQEVQLIYNPKTGARLIIPAERTYVDLRSSNGEVNPLENAAALKQGQVEKKLLGVETEGQGKAAIQYDKYRLSFPDSSPNDRIYLWENKGLENLPTRIRMETADQKFLVALTNVKMGKPDPKYFETPTNYTKSANLDALLSKAMVKALGNLQGKLSIK